MLINLMF